MTNTTKISIKPHIGINQVRFGMTRAEVAVALGQRPERFRRGPFALGDDDFFKPLHVFAYYDQNERCCALEIANSCVLFYGNVSLFSLSAVEALSWARSLDSHLAEKDGFVSKSLGLAMYAPWIDAPDLDAATAMAPAYSFMAFVPGYYENAETDVH